MKQNLTLLVIEVGMITAEPVVAGPMKSTATADLLESASLYKATSALFPTLSFRYPEMQKMHEVAKEVVWIEGTVTVSF
ncbi:MAG TPA: hypothetical protein VN457_02785 [Chlamydiales bacterium]|nr:hypothetical protein [Chlamydiales bacterium]